MSTDNVENLRDDLTQRTRDDLHIIARCLNVRGFHRLKKDELISAILDTDDKSKLARCLSVSWWHKYHNHVYGAVTVLGVILSVFFFLASPPSDDSDQGTARDRAYSPSSIDTSSKNASREITTAITFQEYIDERKRRKDLTSLQQEQFFQHYVGKQVDWVGYVRDIEERGDDVVISMEPERDSSMFDVARCNVPAADKNRFLTLSEGQKVRILGTLTDRFFYGYVVDDCEVKEVWPLDKSHD